MKKFYFFVPKSLPIGERIPMSRVFFLHYFEYSRFLGRRRNLHTLTSVKWFKFSDNQWTDSFVLESFSSRGSSSSF